MQLLLKYQLLAVIFSIITLTKVGCFHFNFSTFQPQDEADNLLLSKNSNIYLDAIQITPDMRGPILNYSGRAFYKKPYRLLSKKKNKIASFNTTFVLNITPQTSPAGGEGVAFILTADTNLPENSAGEWLGIVNASTNGTSQAGIVAVEFDTRKSSTEDGPHNHVGININSISSIKFASLSDTRVNLSSARNVWVRIEYANDIISVFGSMSESYPRMETLLVSPPLNLSSYLQEMVYIGFSASTGNHTQLNCVRLWEFSGVDIEFDDANKNLLWVWIMIPILIIIGGLVFILFYYWQRKRSREKLDDAYPRIKDQRKRKHRKEQGLEENLQIELEIKNSSNAPDKFQLKELLSATRNFNSSNKLGKGGFGTVYKGTLNGKDVAVKRNSKNSSHGKRDFIAEITTIGNLNHKNLVKLIGWCYENGELLLVYEFMPNGSLDRFIFFGETTTSIEDSSSTLSWEKRHSVICGVSKALDYLHNGCDKRVLHRDIKPSNVMLDSDFNARLGDFGLARTIHLSEKSHHSTREIAGTPGYMAPESFHTRRASVETDVYAFGILMLEVVCGRRKPGDKQDQSNYNKSLVDWVWELHGEENITDAVDLRVKGDFDEVQARCVLELGLACCHPNPYERPSMRTVLQVLIAEAAPPFVPLEKPAFTWPVLAPVLKEELLNFNTSGSQNEPITELISGR